MGFWSMMAPAMRQVRWAVQCSGLWQVGNLVLDDCCLAVAMLARPRHTLHGVDDANAGLAAGVPGQMGVKWWEPPGSAWLPRGVDAMAQRGVLFGPFVQFEPFDNGQVGTENSLRPPGAQYDLQLGSDEV